MFRTLRLARRAIAACAALCLFVPAASRAQGGGGTQTEVKQQSAAFTTGSIADQLGAKVVDKTIEFAPGASLTGTVTDPSKLAKFGITGIHEGARITAFRSTPEKVRVEVDEIEPAPLDKKVTLKIDSSGRLSLP